MRYLVWVSMALVCTSLLAPAALADGGMIAEPQRLVEASVQELELLLDVAGGPVAVWEELAAGDAGAMERRVVLWNGGSDARTILAQRPVTASLAVHLLPADGGRYVGWTQTTTRSLTIQRIDTHGLEPRRLSRSRYPRRVATPRRWISKGTPTRSGRRAIASSMSVRARPLP